MIKSGKLCITPQYISEYPRTYIGRCIWARTLLRSLVESFFLQAIETEPDSRNTTYDDIQRVCKTIVHTSRRIVRAVSDTTKHICFDVTTREWLGSSQRSLCVLVGQGFVQWFCRAGDLINYPGSGLAGIPLEMPMLSCVPRTRWQEMGNLIHGAEVFVSCPETGSRALCGPGLIQMCVCRSVKPRGSNCLLEK